MKKIAFLTLMFVSLTACTSLVGKGDKMFASGMYVEAAEFYARALDKDADNLEARMGLDRARHKIIDRGLIAVRVMRLAENYVAAATKLEEILRNQMAWNLELPGVIAETQREETRYAAAWLVKEAKLLANNTQRPDMFRWMLFAYQQIIANSRLDSQLNALRPQVWQAGQQRCQAMTADVKGQRFFLKDFVERYCAAWDVEKRIAIDAHDNERYSRMDVKLTLNNRGAKNSKAALNRASQDAIERFRNSAWYYQQGKQPLSVLLKADLRYDQHSYHEQKAAGYLVTEHFEDKEKDTSETRKVSRTYYYDTKVFRETLDVDINLQATVSGQSVLRNIAKSDVFFSDAHNHRFPEANVYPVKRKYLNIGEKLNGHTAKVTDEFFIALDELWVSKYCETGRADTTGERVLRCARLRPENGYVNNWFTQKFGISYGEISQIYGL